MADRIDFLPAHQHPTEFLIGVLDVVTAMGFALAGLGVITKPGLAEFMATVEAQLDKQADRVGIDRSSPEQLARKLPARVLRETFSMPFVGERNFGVVAGGKTAPGAAGPIETPGEKHAE